MKKNVILVLAAGLTLLGCENYDDQFNDLNSQIAALSNQVAGLSQVQTDLTALAGTVASLQSSISSLPSGSDFNQAVSGLEQLAQQVQSLQEQLNNVASSSDLDAVNSALANVMEELDELLSASNVFNGDLSINSEATLQFAESLGEKVAIINGDVIISITTDMDQAKLQGVVSKIKTITKNLKIRTANSSIAPISMDKLTGVGDLIVAQAGSISFAALQSAGKITLGSNYASKLDGTVNFGALKQVTHFATAEVAADFTLSSESVNTIALVKMGSLNLGAMAYYAPASLTIKGDKNTTIALGALQSKDAAGKDKSYTITVAGALEFDVPGLVLGEVAFTDVKTVKLATFSGKITVNDGVENVTVGALKNDFVVSSNDLETLSLTLDAADKKVDLTDAKGLISATIAGKVKSVLLVNNDDLNTLNLSAAVESLTINNTNLSEVNLDYTNANMAEKGTLIVTGNPDLTAFAANKLDGIQTLTITGNNDLETVSFDALKAVPTKAGAHPKVTVGGVGQANSFNASSIVQNGEGASTGSFTSDSGLDELKTYLTEAAKNQAAVLKVFFDSADDFNDSKTSVSNIKISGSTTDVERLTIINRDGASNAVKAKRAFLVNTKGASTLGVNGTSISWAAGGTNADYISNLTIAANVNQLKNNGVTLMANAHGNPKAQGAVGGTGTTLITGVSAATKKADAQQVKLVVGDYSATLYLSTADITDLTYDPIAGTDKSAEKEILVVNGTTDVDDILEALEAEFGTANGNTSSPYDITHTDGQSTFDIVAKDKSSSHHNKAVKFTVANGINLTPQINLSVSEDDKLVGLDPVIIIESDIPGSTLSTIGNPRSTMDPNTAATTAGDANGNTGNTQIVVTGGDVIELYNDPNNAVMSESTGVTNPGKDSTTAAVNLNRLSWLAG